MIALELSTISFPFSAVNDIPVLSIPYRMLETFGNFEKHWSEENDREEVRYLSDERTVTSNIPDIIK
jgi:hypothetical protein